MHPPKALLVLQFSRFHWAVQVNCRQASTVSSRYQPTLTAAIGARADVDASCVYGQDNLKKREATAAGMDDTKRYRKGLVIPTWFRPQQEDEREGADAMLPIL